MKVTFDRTAAVDAYTRAFRRMRELPGFDQPAVLRAEAGSILKKWAGITKVGTKQEASYRARYRAGKRAFGHTNIAQNPYGISVNTGPRGGFPGEVWYRHPKSRRFQQAGVIHDNGGFTPSFVHWKSPVWSKIQQGAERYGDTLAGLLPFAEKSIGLARQSVIQIADDLGIDLSQVKGQGVSGAGIAKARAAIASSGRAYKNGSGYEGGDGVKDYIQLINRLPFGVQMGMDQGLASVLAGRAKYIETSYARGAFDSIKAAARAFPNIDVSGLAAAA